MQSSKFQTTKRKSWRREKGTEKDESTLNFIKWTLLPIPRFKNKTKTQLNLQNGKIYLENKALRTCQAFFSKRTTDPWKVMTIFTLLNFSEGKLILSHCQWGNFNFSPPAKLLLDWLKSSLKKKSQQNELHYAVRNKWYICLNDIG